MTAAQIIAAFGGRQAMADLTGAKPDAVTQWRYIGIPAKYWPRLVDAAVAKKVAGITFAVLEATKPAKVAA